jgi:predicted alpha/beta hydrolase family esterase
MKKAIILHAWYEKTDMDWYPWLKTELEKKGYTVFLPELPTMSTDSPDLNTLMQFIESLTDIDSETVIIGHSLGALLALRLAEKHTFAKLFSVAGWDYNDLTVEHQSFWPNMIDHAAIKSHVKEIYCIESDNDFVLTAFMAEEMCKRFAGKFILVKGAGHFTTKDDSITQVPELLNFI